MNLRHLQTFVAVADVGGLARAAVRINLSQPAASRQILALEAELGVALFDRIGRRIHLTSEGQDLLERGRRLLADAASFGERALSLKGGHTGTLRVGAPTQVIENLLAPFVPGFQKRYPGVEVHLLEAAATRLQSHVDRGDVQLGILPSGHDALLGELLYPIHIMVAVAQKHPLWWLWRKSIRSPVGARSKSWSSPTNRCCYSAANLACDPGLKRRVTLPTLDHACCWRAPLHTLLLHWRARGTELRLFPLMCGSRGVNVCLVPLVHRGAPVGRWAIVAWDPRQFLAPYVAQFVKELAASVRRSFPGRDVIRRVPPLPRPKL